ncbi:MAG TPA: hypothetical protein VMG60_08695 [Burkholderiaceae bacterium]|nr:hypothetical protein [Burkholderiaceae bacterium]
MLGTVAPSSGGRMHDMLGVVKPGRPNQVSAQTPLRSTRLPDRLRDRLRYCHYSLRTGQAYVHGVRWFVRFGGHIKDVDFDRKAIVVRDGRGDRDRVVMLQGALEAVLRHQVGVRALWAWQPAQLPPRRRSPN